MPAVSMALAGMNWVTKSELSVPKPGTSTLPRSCMVVRERMGSAAMVWPVTVNDESMTTSRESLTSEPPMVESSLQLTIGAIAMRVRAAAAAHFIAALYLVFFIVFSEE